MTVRPMVSAVIVPSPATDATDALSLVQLRARDSVLSTSTVAGTFWRSPTQSVEVGLAIATLRAVVTNSCAVATTRGSAID